MKDIIGVSACLLGINCKYNGSHNLDPKVIDYIRGKEIVLICPEVFGGLGTPRIPCEIQKDGKIINKIGLDVTENFKIGKEKTLELLKCNNCSKVILKDGSPSCGYTRIYDGTFTNKLIKGLGVTARYLIENKIDIIDL
ncbi:DUF523 domain-containing protein [Candidatus Izemoplasma sp. B36]|uniref:DUF523 domain-containing protein n=1 Tax=Candidatus Izemoplasma sp. B36 TaxID=3242468 RepID=UPI0035569708